MRFASLALVVASALVVGCTNDDSVAPTPAGTESDASKVTAAAIESFGSRFGPDVVVPDVVVISESVARADVAELLGTRFVVSTDVPADESAHWRVIAVVDEGDYWSVVLASVLGSTYFEAKQYFVHDGNGFRQVEADDVGETLVTSVS